MDNNRYISFYTELIGHGVLLQGNLKSLISTYGLTSKKMITEMLQRNMIHFIGTDNHNYGLNLFNVAEAELEKIVGSVKKNELMNLNAETVLENKIFTAEDVVEIKKEGLLKKLANLRIF